MRYLILFLLCSCIAIGAEEKSHVYPKTISEVIEFESAKQGVPGRVMVAICYLESGLNTKAINYNDGDSHSYGICQIKYETAKTIGFTGTPKQLMNPIINIRYAIRYMKANLVRYNNDVNKAISAYNRGTASETPLKTSYVRKVIRLAYK